MTVWELFDLSGRAAIVTGGATGLGRQMATALLEAGAAVVIASRRQELCRRVASELSEQTGGQCIGMRCDVTDPAEVERLFSDVLDRLGRLDILVNNAGGTRRALLDEAALEDWEYVMRLNATGTFLCSQQAARIFMRQRSGKIINIASIYGIVGVDQRLYECSPEFVPGSIPYVASKGAVVQMTRDMACYLAPYNVQVNCISPGGFRGNQDDEFLKRYEFRCPLGRMGGPEDLKGAVVFLASRASDYVTGHNLVVDGGWTAW